MYLIISLACYKLGTKLKLPSTYETIINHPELNKHNYWSINPKRDHYFRTLWFDPKEIGLKPDEVYKILAEPYIMFQYNLRDEPEDKEEYWAEYIKKLNEGKCLKKGDKVKLPVIDIRKI
ncbi:MAG: hypothetical protein HZB65_03460 [Candidatus Aenigmarchaeota archaeon]|nr:hypothetical protein [Candidatus Aenigmarchaeota archaeon]